MVLFITVQLMGNISFSVIKIYQTMQKTRTVFLWIKIRFKPFLFLQKDSLSIANSFHSEQHKNQHTQFKQFTWRRIYLH